MGSHKNDIWLAEAGTDDMRAQLKEAGYSAQEVDAADELWLHHRLEKHFEYQRHLEEQQEREDGEGND